MSHWVLMLHTHNPPMMCVCVCVCVCVRVWVCARVLCRYHLVPGGFTLFQLIPHFRLCGIFDVHACIFLMFLQIFSQINSNTRGCRRTVTEKLKKIWSHEKYKINFQRCIFVKFPEKDTHKWHLTNEVRHFFFKC